MWVKKCKPGKVAVQFTKDTVSQGKNGEHPFDLRYRFSITYKKTASLLKRRLVTIFATIFIYSSSNEIG